MTPPDPDTGTSRLRILILSADVGEGHVAAARALCEGFAGDTNVHVHTEDGLRHLGRLARAVIRDGYRFQLRWTPWAYNALYAIWRSVVPLRWLGSRLLYRLGRRRLRALVRLHRPDIVVSTHPALTVVLGQMRRRGGLDVVLCATITDLTDDPMWCHRGADLHLVMHPIAVRWVERQAGRGSAVAVRPLVSPRFYAPPDVAHARASLALPGTGSLVIVSGGGWGVGALADGVDAVLAAGTDRMVVLAGRNERARIALEDRYRGEDRVRVLGFTDLMPELLGAATALVHGTGGVTSLEAIACGCPVIAFGTRLAHVEEHNRAMERLGLCTIARDVVALEAAVATRLAAPASAACAPTVTMATLDAARAVREAVRRVVPVPRWVMTLQRLSLALACSAGLLWTVATDDAFSLVAPPLGLRPSTRLAVSQPAVALVVSAPPAEVPAIAGQLTRHGLHVTFAVAGPPTPASVRSLRRDHDDVVPVLPGSGAVRWLTTIDDLRDVLGPGVGHDFLTSRGLSLGQYLLARSAGVRPLAVAATFGTRGAARPLRYGDIVLDSVTGPAPASSVLRVALRLSSEGLSVLTLSQLAADSSSMRARTASDRESSTAAAIRTQATAAAETGIPTGPLAIGSAVTSGLSRTGTRTCMTKTEGATRVAAERCSAVISASRPRPEAAPVAAVQSAARGQSPPCTASATSWVDRPLHAKHNPATNGALRIARGRRCTTSQRHATAAPSAASTVAISPPDRWASRGAGATAARATTPTTIIVTAARSTDVTRSLSRPAPIAKRAIRPMASAGWTTDSGASSSAAVCTGQPMNPSAVPASQRGRRSRRPISPARHAWSVEVSRASSACSATLRL
jgi:processive 1,2-diacylglycerol beta-glucosyltransferase